MKRRLLSPQPHLRTHAMMYKIFRTPSLMQEPKRKNCMPPHLFFPPSATSLGTITSFPASSVFTTLLPCSSKPHHSRWNFSASFLFSSLSSRSFRLESLVANHSSRALSCSSKVAYCIMQLFMALCVTRQEKVAMNVCCRAQAAKSVMRSVRSCLDIELRHDSEDRSHASRDLEIILPLISSAHFARTRLWYISLTCCS